ncbi:MAG: hypothetical protein HUJ95_02795 [Bacteroidales bacterium]|nr:hypothetical protein [Bacteroidales bacterium]
MTRIKFNSEGFKQILLSDGTKGLVWSNTQAIQERAGEGFKGEIVKGSFGDGRWVGFVNSTDLASAQAESENKVLSRAVTG